MRTKSPKDSHSMHRQQQNWREKSVFVWCCVFFYFSFILLSQRHQSVSIPYGAKRRRRAIVTEMQNLYSMWHCVPGKSELQNNWQMMAESISPDECKRLWYGYVMKPIPCLMPHAGASYALSMYHSSGRYFDEVFIIVLNKN